MAQAKGRKPLVDQAISATRAGQIRNALVSRCRCFLPDLTGFTRTCRAGPSPGDTGYPQAKSMRKTVMIQLHSWTSGFSKQSETTFWIAPKVEGRMLQDRINQTGGERGIRTLGTLTSTHAFQACSFNHSDISPLLSSPTEDGEAYKHAPLEQGASN